MSEKLGKDESIARVYQFLQGRTNWKTEADTINEDGVITQSEFRGYMLLNVDEWNGQEKYDSNDIITKFWNSVDVNTTGKTISGVSNALHLSVDEIDSMERNIEITKAINELLSTQGAEYQCPKAIKDTERWTDSMRASLLNKSKGYTGSVENQDDIIGFLKTIFKQSAAKTNADCLKDQLMNDTFANILNEYPEYKYNEDSVLNNIFNNYIATLTGNESFEDIKDTITCLLQDYFTVSGIANMTGNVGASTAFDVNEYDENGQVILNDDGTPKVKPGSQTTAEERLKKYGGYDNNGMLNDLQKQVVTKSMKNAIDSALSQHPTYKEKYSKNKVDFRDFINNYINEKVSSATISDFESLKSFNGNTMISEKKAELDDLLIKIDEINVKRDELIKKLYNQYSRADEYKSERQALIKEIFGATATSESGIRTIIYGLTETEFTAKAAEFITKNSIIEGKIAKKALAKVPSVVSTVEGSGLQLITLDSTLTSLKITSSNSECPLTISETGLSINSDKSGEWATKIEVLDEAGTVIASKDITVKIFPKMDLTKSEATFRGDKISDLMARNDKNIDLTGFGGKNKDTFNLAKQNLNGYIDNLADIILAGDGYDDEKLQTAAHNTKAYYSAILDAIWNKGAYDCRSTSGLGGSRSLECSYIDANGNSVKINTSVATNTYSDNYDVDGRMNTNLNSCGICVNYGYSDNGMQVTINTQVLLRKFMEFYNT